MGSLDYRFSIFVIYFLCFVRSEEILPSYYAEEQCDNTISRSQPAGVIKFERINYFTDCLITVSPKRLFTGPGKVMLYFTEFDLPSPCSSINVEVLDGNDPRFASPVKGLPKTLCKRNTTLIQTGMVFNTTGPTFALLIRRNVFGTQDTGNFVLKFASYSEGPCPVLDNVTTCENGRCTPSEFHCHSEIDTCGLSEEEVCEEEDSVWEAIGKSIWETIRTILIIAAVCVCIVFVGKFIKALKGNNFMQRFADGVRSNVSSLSSLRMPRPQTRSERTVRSPTPPITTIETNRQPSITDRDTESVSSFNTSSSGISSRPSSRPVDNSSSPPSYDQLEPGHPVTFNNSDRISLSNISVSDLPQSRDMNDSTDVPPSYDALAPTPSAPPAVPEAPPPSYDDFISNEQRYKNESNI